MDAQPLTSRITDVYKNLNAENLDQLHSIYASDIIFEDPAHRVEGLAALTSYFEALYANVHSCQFKFDRIVANDDAICISWVMHLSHPKLKGGDQVEIPGCTMMLVEGDKVCHHRDYFDLGNLLYEHIPVLGSLITHLKRKLGS